ncbi:hypothetical protein [Mycolicibacterium fluoranthenivorans]|uniref:Secreted protein n=1 Tax=Mycolicibacterium fluoranthenivorans TaxID=258505 RepID=A0A7X5TYG1_9MYCO|nr:hypothetical protein [Mycolicibacterium fluoranthenivorans]MCV7358930.1 hypothetical protein [Mycolicibacterium fluoranthenivorans]NIH95049.1 hypothetical protein [Mycolicibacterium fluoranthenivorans]
MIAKALAVAAATTGLVALSVCTALADTPRFPDMTAYAPVDILDYAIDTTTPGMPSSEIYFATPDGVICNITAVQAQCSGNNLPAIPPAVSDPSRNFNRVNWIGTASGLKQTNEGAVPNPLNGQTIKTLPPLHSISAFGALCGVDDKGTTACKDSRGRGFVLSPQGSGWLPKV